MKRLTMRSREWYSPCDDINIFSVVKRPVNSNSHRYHSHSHRYHSHSHSHGFHINRKRQAWKKTWRRKIISKPLWHLAETILDLAERFEITWKDLSARFQNSLWRNMPSWLADYLLSHASFFPGLGRGLKRRTFTCSLCKKPKTREYGHTMVKKIWYCPSMGLLDEWLRKRTFNFIFYKHVKFYGLGLYVPAIFYSLEFG